MEKIKVKIIVLGHLKRPLKTEILRKWKSDIIDINSDINHYTLNSNSDKGPWLFSDENLSKQIPTDFNENFLVVIVNVPLENNYYTRRLTGNRIVITMHDIYSILENDNIIFENLIIHRIYAYSILYKRYKKIPDHTIKNSHDETRGCLFDMNPYKEDIIYSSRKPIFCDSCYSNQTQNSVPIDFLNSVRKEIKKIRKSNYYLIEGFIKKNPEWSIALSILAAFLINLLSTIFWERICK